MSKSIKLNKSQNWELILNAINNAVAETDTLKKGTEAKFTAQLIEQLHFMQPKQGSSTKMNDNGEVYCNYFGEYLPADEFNTKLGKPNKTTGERIEGYKANCKEAEVILRKIKTTKANYNKQVMANFMDKTITAGEMELFLNNLEAAFAGDNYVNIEQIPTITEILDWHSTSE